MSGVANNVAGSTIFSENNVTGGPNDVTVRDLIVENSLTIDNTFNINTVTAIDGIFTNDLEVQGDTIVDGNITTDGTLVANNGLTITGDSYLNGNLFVDDDAFVTNFDANGVVVVGNSVTPPAPGTLEVLTCYGDADISGTLFVQGAQVSGPAGTTTGAIQFRSAVPSLGADDDFLIESAPKRLRIAATTASTGPTSGSFVTAGGVGISGNLFSSGRFVTTDNTVSSGTGSGSIVTAGGVGIGGATHVGGQLHAVATTASTSTTTGCIRASGGVGIAGAVNIGGDTKVLSTTTSTNSATGCFTAAGGVGIAGNMNIAGEAKCLSTLVVGPGASNLNSTTACIQQNTIDTVVNGTVDGTAINILSLKTPGREWIFGSSGATNSEFYLGTTGGVAEDPDYKYYYDTGGRFAVLGNPVGAIAAPTALFTVRGTSEFTGDADFISTTNATTGDGTTGAIQTLGGIGAAKDIRNLGLLANTNTTDSTTTDGLSGAFRTLGGASIAKSLQVGSNFVANGNTTLGLDSVNVLTCNAKASLLNGVRFTTAQSFFRIHTDSANTAASGEVTFTTPLNMFTVLPTATVSALVNNTSQRVCWIRTGTYASGVATFVCRVVDTANAAVSGATVNIHCIGS